MSVVDETKSIESFSRTSKTDDFNMIPVARSYNSFPWERVAGAYQDFTSISCASGLCSLEIPSLPAYDDGHFVLMSFMNTAANGKEQVSRFFQRTTFGPTMAMINSWNYDQEMSQGMSNWLEQQMDETQTTPTSHRAYFRKNLDRAAVFEGGSANGVKRFNDHFHGYHPCDQYARWREYSFTVDDFYMDVRMPIFICFLFTLS